MLKSSKTNQTLQKATALTANQDGEWEEKVNAHLAKMGFTWN
jgi:hypothetical protein